MNTLRETLYQTIHRNKKPLKAIAEEIGISENYLTRAALPDPEESETGSGCRFPLKKLVPLIRATGDFSVLDQIEQSVDRVAIPLPKANASQDHIYRMALQTVKEFGDMMGSLDVGIADGKLSDDEIAKISREGNEAVQAIVSMLHTLTAAKRS
jgi:hypothetical protein